MLTDLDKSIPRHHSIQGVTSLLLRLWIQFSELKHRYKSDNGIVYFYWHNEEMHEKALQLDTHSFDKTIKLLDHHLQEMMVFDAVNYTRICDCVEIIEEFTKVYIIPVMNDDSTSFIDRQEMLCLQLPKACSLVEKYIKLLYIDFSSEYQRIEKLMNELTEKHENEIIDFGVRMFEVYENLYPLISLIIPDEERCRKVLSSFTFSFLLRRLFQTNAFNKLSIGKGYLGFMSVYYSANASVDKDNLKKATIINQEGVNAIITGLTKLYITEYEEEAVFKDSQELKSALDFILNEYKEYVEEEPEKFEKIKSIVEEIINGKRSINKVIRNIGAHLRLNRIEENSFSLEDE